MSMTLDLKPEVENALRDCATAEGVSIADLLARTFLPRAAGKTKSEAPRDRVRALLAQWQAQDETPIAAPAPNEGTMTPSEALFYKWEQEDALLTDEEHQKQVAQWEAFQQGVNLERAQAGMRTVF